MTSATGHGKPEVPHVLRPIDASVYPFVDAVWCLGPYSQVDVATDRKRQTATGNAVHRAKYWDRSPLSAQMGVDEVTFALTEAIRGSEELKAVHAVIVTPSHADGENRLAPILAKDVSIEFRRRLIVPATRRAVRRQAKNGVKDLRGEFLFEEPISGTVLIVDDVLGQGRTLCAIAEAATKAGADRVLAVIAAYKPD